MKPRITIITLGVNDLEKALTFYRDGLGFPTEGIIGKEFEHGAVAFFDLQSGLKLALWPRRNIAWDAGIREGAQSATELTIAHNVSSDKEVDAVMEQARKAGAKITKEAQATFYGSYAGYFQDPDGHLWEVAWNPQFEIVESPSQPSSA
jgi:catechol 2,3-dioxygenase-like lactoylglutathione lyase family enzyme